MVIIIECFSFLIYVLPGKVIFKQAKELVNKIF